MQPLACVTVWSCPPIVIVPVRAGPVFAPTEKLTVPLPVPLAPDVIVSHGAEATLVQPQPLAAVTAIAVALPPPAPTVCDVGLMPTVHPLVCVTVWT